MKIVIFESMLAKKLVGHEVWLNNIIKALKAATPASVTVVGQKTMSQTVCEAIGTDCQFVAGIEDNYLKDSLGGIGPKSRGYFLSRRKMAQETAQLIEKFSDADLHIFPTAMPTTAAAVAIARKRAKQTALLFHFSHEEAADKILLEQFSVLSMFRKLAEDSVQCLATSPGLATELQEMGIATTLAPYPYHAAPNEHAARKTCRRVGLFGHQRADKDGGLLWPLVNDLLARGFEVVLHDSSGKPNIFHHPALVYVNRFLPPSEFMALVQTCDLLIIPNEARFFSHRISGVTLDALSAAVPLVVPDNTHMSRLVRRFNAGVIYQERTPQGVSRAVLKAKQNFAAHAQGAFKAANWLRATGGYNRLAQAFLKLEAATHKQDMCSPLPAKPQQSPLTAQKSLIASGCNHVQQADGLHRSEIINAIISALGVAAGFYLEIGVRRPEDNFDKIKCANKWSVDPGYENPANPASFKVNSDVFFDNLASGRYPELPGNFDVIFIDGLHTADQAYRDARHALDWLAPGGVIVMHDCNPPTEAHARANYADKNTSAGGAWNGTVWKAFTELRKDPALSCFCLPDDWGVGLILPSPGFSSPVERSFNPFFDYEIFAEARALALGLVDFSKAMALLERYNQAK